MIEAIDKLCTRSFALGLVVMFAPMLMLVHLQSKRIERAKIEGAAAAATAAYVQRVAESLREAGYQVDLPTEDLEFGEGALRRAVERERAKQLKAP